MQMGMIGLGRMGANMVRRLMLGGHECSVYDLNPDHVAAMVKEGAIGAPSLQALVSSLKRPRPLWVMVPAGGPTEQTVEMLGRLLEDNDIIIDGGNSHYKDDVRRAEALKPRGIRYVDVGTSGGIYGLERGYCLMIGGEEDAVRHLDPLFKTLAPGRGAIPRTPHREATEGTAEEGYLLCGPAGAGHFVKMIHNGIEYGMMQAYAEGFDVLVNADSEALPEKHRYRFPLAQIAEVWRRGSVISSWLLDLTAAALVQDPALSRFTGFVEDSGEGRWTVNAALEEAVPVPVLTAALFNRFRSRKSRPFGDKLLSAMRHQFGGHRERPGTKGDTP